MSGRRRRSNIGRRTVNARRTRSARDEETSTEREARRNQDRDRRRAQRARETSVERETRLSRERARPRIQRARESLVERLSNSKVAAPVEFKLGQKLKMPHRCYVPLCKSGYASNSERVSMHKPPRAHLEQWNNIISRPDKTLTTRDHVCEKHFLDSDIIREWVSKDGATIIPHKVPRLKKGAVPCIFPCFPGINLLQPSKRKKGVVKLDRTAKQPSKRKKSVVNLDRTAKFPKVDIEDQFSNDGEMTSSESKLVPFEFVECA